MRVKPLKPFRRPSGRLGQERIDATWAEDDSDLA